MGNIEEWRDIKGFEGKYQVSNFGRVRSLDRYVAWRGTAKFFPSAMMKQTKSKKGYYLISLCTGTHRGKFTDQVHRLVWKTFRSEVPSDLVVDHIDDNKTNNRLDNLQLLTNRDNCVKGWRRHRTLPVGCYYREDTGKFASKIQIDKKKIYLGNFNCPTAAALAYQKALGRVL